jgi:Flp pilus assembly pilin Flp
MQLAQRPGVFRVALRSSTRLSRLRFDQVGALMVEYVVLLGSVSILCAAAVAGLGPPFVKAYERTRAILVSPVP